jgi:nucleoside phosphorylase
MIYILVALKAEAQAFVDKFKLQNYKNENITLIISGIGKENMYKTTFDVLSNFKEDDFILNVGICGANHNYKIGQLIDSRKEHITCVNYEVSATKYNIIDMESAGFIKATKDIKNSYIFKIVSDHFEPNIVTKDKAKKLIFNKIGEIMKEIGQ